MPDEHPAAVAEPGEMQAHLVTGRPVVRRDARMALVPRWGHAIDEDEGHTPPGQRLQILGCRYVGQGDPGRPLLQKRGDELRLPRGPIFAVFRCVENEAVE